MIVRVDDMTTETTIAELRDDFLAMGIFSRDVMVHSSFKALRPVHDGPAGVVEALVQAVGDGVLLMPCFDFTSWSEAGYWDRDNSPSRMGAISETARKDERFKRTPHSMLSYACASWSKGKYHGYFEDVPNAHGASSVFDRLIKNYGLLLSFSGEGFRKNDVGFTISNHCAVLAEAPWRFTKVFEGTYVDGGVPSIRKYSASVCRRDKYVTEVTPAHEAAEREGIIKRHKLGRTECLVASAREFVAWGITAHRERPELWRKRSRDLLLASLLR